MVLPAAHPAMVSGSCVFCGIAEGRVAADVVGETTGAIAFRDIHPAAPVHLLLAPKSHIVSSASELTEQHAQLLGELFALGARVADDHGLEGTYRIVTNSGPGAGQTVFHLHFHLMGGWGGASRPRPLAAEHGG